RETRAVMRLARSPAIHAATETRTGGRERLPLAVTVLEVIEPGEVDEDLELQFRIVAQGQAYRLDVGGLDFVAKLVGQRRHPRELVGPRFDLGGERGDFGWIRHWQWSWCVRSSSAAG